MRLLCQHWGCFLCGGAAHFALDVPLAPSLLCGAGLRSRPSVEIFLCGFVWFSRVWFVQWFRVVLRMLSRAGVVSDGEVTRMVQSETLAPAYSVLVLHCALGGGQVVPASSVLSPLQEGH